VDDSGGKTKPIAFAPADAPPLRPSEKTMRVVDDLPLVSSGSGTKPVGSAPEGADTGAQGYVVRGFSPSANDALDVPRVVLEDAAAARARYGDRAGEDQWMARRDGVSAWGDVFAGFVLFDVIVASAATFGIAEAMARAHVANDAASVALGAIVGLAVALGCFSDRWRCTEAFASRYVRGALSHAWVPLVVIGYGLFRGVRKLRGR
jgi:hypothetical protein